VDDLEKVGEHEDPTGGSLSASLYVRHCRRPTDKLIDEIEMGDAKPQLIGATVTQTFNIHGNNPRINMNSTDNSVNIVTVSGDQLFDLLRETARSVENESERTEILAKLDELQQAQGSAGFVNAYQNFIGRVANYMTIFGPFIPALTQMLSAR
jgi:hypothetical protein